MSVFTEINDKLLKSFLSDYDVGELKSFEGISDGIQNSNFFVTTSKERFVLTIFEHHASKELDYFLDMMRYLYEHDVPTAHPVINRNGRSLGEIAGKPAALVYCLQGASIECPTEKDCEAVGYALGLMHQVGLGFKQRRASCKGPDWWTQAMKRLQPVISCEESDLIQSEIIFQAELDTAKLPVGIIHADLFRDNVLFDQGKISGFIDFYNACNERLIFDVAVTINDWCRLPDSTLHIRRANRLLAAYQAKRKYSDLECQHWLNMLRAAALRFWLSRLIDLHFPRAGLITHTKNPDEFKILLLNYRKSPPTFNLN